MFVNRLRMLGVKNLRRDIPLEGSLPEPARKRLLFQGANGSGKTTILETIFHLWRLFGEWIDAGEGAILTHATIPATLAGADLAAIEFRGFDKSLDSLWVGIGTKDSWEKLQTQNPQSSFAKLVSESTTGSAGAEYRLELPDLDLPTLRQRVLVGKVGRPNLVYFPPETRMLLPAEAERPHLVNLQEYLWAAEFAPRLDLDGLLTTVKAHDPDRYSWAVVLVNELLRNQGKKLVLRRRAPRHEVELVLESGELAYHSQDLLSSGEKQIVLMVAFAACLLQDGGILIVDEPDLHIHSAMVKPLVGVLYQLTQERKGQLIVAAHSTQLRNWFVDSAEQIALNPWRGGAKP